MKKRLFAAIAAAALMTAGTAALPVFTGSDTTYSITASAAVSKLPAPTGLSYLAEGTGQIRLTWDNVYGADGYVVYRFNALTGNWTKMKSVRSNHLTISGIKSGKTYYYKVAPLRGYKGKYYRGYFSDYIAVKYNYAETPLSESGNISQQKQQEFLASYYKSDLSVSGKNPMNAQSSKAYIANAQEYGGQVMLVEYTFKDGKKLTYAFCIANSRVTTVGGGLIADSSMRMNQSACFIKEKTGNNYYIMVEGQFSINYYCSISKATSAGLVEKYNISSIYDAIYYLNNEETDYGTYLKLMDNFQKAESSGDDEITYLD